MSYLLWEYFGNSVAGMGLLRYITVRTAAAAIFAFLVMIVLGPRFVEWLKRLQFDQQIRDDGPESHQKKTGTPTMGGILIFFAFFVSSVLFANLGNLFVILILFGTLGFVAIGFVDDVLCVVQKNSKGLSGKVRLSLEGGLSTVFVGILLLHPEWSGELWFPLDKNLHPEIGYLYLPLAFLVVVGTANGVNLTDGLDGLATGVALPVLGALAIMTYASGHTEIARYLAIFYSSMVGEITVLIGALMGALMGFLWFNAHPAALFMGDTGSLGIGGFIGLTAIAIKQELVLPILCIVFFAETLSVIVQVGSFKSRGKRVFRMAPIHHHFELGGWAENKVIVRFWIIAVLGAAMAVALLKVR